MQIDKLRYFLTLHEEKFFFTYENKRLLIHPSVTIYNDLINRIKDDIELMPELPKTIDNTEIKFYMFDYNEALFKKSELLAFIYASINENWNIIKGTDKITLKTHFWLKNGNVIYDPSLAIITRLDVYQTKFNETDEIKNKDVITYLTENDNLQKYYQKGLLKSLFSKKGDFSINFINKVTEELNKKIESLYELNTRRIESIKRYFFLNEFLELRQVLTRQRKSFLQSANIALHPDIDASILETIRGYAKNIQELMLKEYNLNINYYHNTIGNCYALSILLNLYDESFKLVQGGIPRERDYYQHSWLERNNIIYDPSLRIITTKDLYYIFVEKKDIYTKEETENILRNIGFNLTHFRDFMNGKQIGNDETLRYRFLINKIGSPEMQEQGEKLISLVKSLKK